MVVETLTKYKLEARKDAFENPLKMQLKLLLYVIVKKNLRYHFRKTTMS